MDPNALPEDLSTLNEQELSDLLIKIGEHGEEIAAADDISDAEMAELEALTEAKERIDAEMASRQEMAAEKAARVEASLSKLRGPETAEVADDAAEELSDEAPETTDEIVPVEAATTETGEELATETEEVIVADEVTPAGGSAASLANRRPAAVAPKANTAPLAFSATGFAVDPEGTTYEDTRSLAESVAKKRLGMSHIPSGVSQDYVRLASYQKPQGDHVLGNKAEDNGVVFRQAQREAQALVASGAVCAPLDPVWDKITLGETFDADLEQALPTIQASQGGIRFRPYSKPDISRMMAGVGHYLYGARETAPDTVPNALYPKPSPTLPANAGDVQKAGQYVGLPSTTGADMTAMSGAQNEPITVAGSTTGGSAGVLDPSNPKPCATLVCIDEAVCYIEAFSTCLKVDNLQYRITPDLVEEAQADLATAYQLAKEQWILSFMDGISTDIDFDLSALDVGPAAGILFALETAAVGYRKAHLLSSTATVQAFVERSHFAQLALDVAIACGVDDPWAAMSRFTEAEIGAELRRRNIDVVWYTDPVLAGSAVADANALMALVYGTGATVANALTPQEIHAYMGAPGAITKLDGGTLDLGLVRDSVLNGTNDLQIFMEEWLGLCNRGIEMWDLAITTNASGTRVAC